MTQCLRDLVICLCVDHTGYDCLCSRLHDGCVSTAGNVYSSQTHILTLGISRVSVLPWILYLFQVMFSGLINFRFILNDGIVFLHYTYLWWALLFWSIKGPGKWTLYNYSRVTTHNSRHTGYCWAKMLQYWGQLLFNTSLLCY